MNREELIERLKGYEWNDIEFKSAQTDVPRNAYETVAAFANTAGGWLIFGVKQEGCEFEIIGVIEVDKVQNDFITAMRSTEKLNKVIPFKEHLVEDGDKTLLIFHIPEVNRTDKPIFLNRSINRTFIRKGGCDVRCSEDELKRIIADASTERYDCQCVELNPEHCFDAESLSWYRSIINQRNPGTEASSNVEFLNHWGLVIEQDGKLVPTRASVFLFGTDAVIRQVLPRPIIDCQWINSSFEEVLPEERWTDRLVMEVNLVKTWQSVLDRYMQHAEKPFKIDYKNLQRDDTPQDYIAFREACINLLIHQDFSSHGHKASIKFYQDRTIFWNPGDAFATTNELLEPGEKEVRNPKIVEAFRRIGLSERAGTGVRTIFGSWQSLGNVPPEINNDKGQKTFEITLPKELLLSEEQILFNASLGVHLEEVEAKLFAYACLKGKFGISEAKSITRQSTSDTRQILDRLVTQALIELVHDDENPYFLVAKHLRERFIEAKSAKDSLVSDQVPEKPAKLVTDQPQPLSELNETQEKILMFCDVPRSMKDLMEHVEMSHRTFFRNNHLEPMVAGGIMAMKYPDQLNHPKQSYFLTPAGVELKARRLSKDEDK